MAGTDRRKSRAAAHVEKGAPAVILVRTQLGENIGAAARAMLNCGLSDLRLVEPRDGWPNVKALGAASGADAVLSGARLCATVDEAVADLNLVHATTARPREMLKPELAPRAAVTALRDAGRRGARLGLLFGPEKAGLKNEELVLADAIVRIPLNPAFASLNLAQAVLIMAYEWRLTSGPLEEEAEPPPPMGSARPATKDEILHFFDASGGRARCARLLPDARDAAQDGAEHADHVRAHFAHPPGRADAARRRARAHERDRAGANRRARPIDTGPSAAIVRPARRPSAAARVLPPARAR